MVLFVIVGVVDQDVENHEAEQLGHLHPAQRQLRHATPAQKLGEL